MSRVVMLVSNRYDPDPRVHKQARSLVRAGYEVHVLAWDREHELDEHTELDGVQVERLRARRAALGDLSATALGLRSFHRAARHRLRELAPRVVHCHDHDTCAVGVWWKHLGARRAGVRRGRFVFDAHDLYWTWLSMGGSKAAWRRAAAALLKAKDRFYARQADLLITVTEQRGRFPGLAEIYREWGSEPCVILNAPERITDRPPLPSRFTLGYLGTVRETAMFEWLTAAIAQLPADERPALRVAGGGVAQHTVAQHLETFGKSNGVRVEVTGRFSMSDVPRLLRDISVQYCVYPTGRGNMDRALPVKMLESAAYGRPVIANANSLMEPWVLESGWGWCVEEGNIHQLSTALKTAASWHVQQPKPTMIDPPYWDEQAQKLVTAYERLLQASR